MRARAHNHPFTALLLVAICIPVSCTSVGPSKPTMPAHAVPHTQYPPAYEALAALAQQTPRRGRLRVEGDTLHLQLQRGSRSSPFLSVARREVERSCWQAAPAVRDPDTTVGHASSWWIFYDERNAVAAEFDAHNVHFWFWDTERECAVRVPAFEQPSLRESAPPEFYKGDDVQIAYLWNYAYQDHQTNHQRVQADGDREAELIEEVPGLEQLVVEKNLVSILAADGTSLLQSSFDVDAQWPCYNSQLTVFREATGGVYAITSFEMFGNEESCDAVSRLSRYGSTIAVWDPNAGQFVQRFALVDQLDQPTPSAETTDVSVVRHLDVAGGALIMATRNRTERSERTAMFCEDRDVGSGVCLITKSCTDWMSLDERSTSWTFRSRDGLEIPVGTGLDSYREDVKDCPGSIP